MRGVDKSKRRRSPRWLRRKIVTTEIPRITTAAHRPRSGLRTRAQNPSMAAEPMPVNSRPRPIAGPIIRRRATNASKAIPGVMANTHELTKSTMTEIESAADDGPLPNREAAAVVKTAMSGASVHVHERRALLPFGEGVTSVRATRWDCCLIRIATQSFANNMPPFRSKLPARERLDLDALVGVDLAGVKSEFGERPLQVFAGQGQIRT